MLKNNMKTENYNGSDATGNSGETSRVLTLLNTRSTRDDGLLIVVDTFVLHPSIDFTISHKISSSQVTFLNPLFNSQRITITYEVISYGITEEFVGSNATGNNGELNRTITLSNIQKTVDGGMYVIVNGAYLIPASDYTIVHNSSSSIITFLNPLFDVQPIIVTYITAGVGGIIPLDIASINNEISYFGTSVTLRVVTDSSYSKWGDATESNSDSTKVAFVQVLRQEDELIKEGIFQSGDKIFWFKGDETNIIRGNRIRHNALWYEINEVIEHDIASTTYVLEARTRKI